AFLWLGLAATGVWAQGILQSYEVEPLTLELADGSRHDFQVEMAETRAQQVQGLMFRRNMDQFAGMLFVYDREAERTMWMKNTYIPLDMLFIDKNGIVVSYRERAVPGSLATIASGAPAMAVLELNSGMIARLGIRPGDRVLQRIFGTAP
ncbi:MAG TPA: DUF192 domain-containing protein, partial [Kiloniellaceae bacterium]|nr:DUF192 domain-containing protein [Kiloniellaceae bacterium]